MFLQALDVACGGRIGRQTVSLKKTIVAVPHGIRILVDAAVADVMRCDAMNGVTDGVSSGSTWGQTIGEAAYPVPL